MVVHPVSAPGGTGCFGSVGKIQTCAVCGPHRIEIYGIYHGCGKDTHDSRINVQYFSFLKEEHALKNMDEPQDINGRQCYLPDGDHVWIPATIRSHDLSSGLLEVEVEHHPVGNKKSKKGQSKKKEIRSIQLGNASLQQTLREAVGADAASDVLQLPLKNPTTNPEGFTDMIALNYLHEPAILYNLKHRFELGLPYTYTGKITIAMNPYRWLGELYSSETKERYASSNVGGTLVNNIREVLAPHVYATSVDAYDDVRLSDQNQSILVSGESGAGKTETTKILMHHLAALAGGVQDSTIARILAVNPLLEAFGNAQTSRNDNSSRFGKFLQLELDERYQLVGASCETYLLERTRVVRHASSERNFHIFYQILAGASDDEMKAWFVTPDVLEYRYLQQRKSGHAAGTSSISSSFKFDGKTDREHFESTKAALALIHISALVQVQLFQVLVVILNLGQIDFEPDPENEEGSKIAASSEGKVASIGSVLGISTEALSKALCVRTMMTNQETYNVPLSLAKAQENRDALAKVLYSRIFQWLVVQMNQTLQQDQANVEYQIGILDIFGFEYFEHNSVRVVVIILMNP